MSKVEIALYGNYLIESFEKHVYMWDKLLWDLIIYIERL